MIPVQEMTNLIKKKCELLNSGRLCFDDEIELINALANLINACGSAKNVINEF